MTFPDDHCKELQMVNAALIDGHKAVTEDQLDHRDNQGVPVAEAEAAARDDWHVEAGLAESPALPGSTPRRLQGINDCNRDIYYAVANTPCEKYVRTKLREMELRLAELGGG